MPRPGLRLRGGAGLLRGPALVRDKDGISAALLIAEFAAAAKAAGRTIFDTLDELAPACTGCTPTDQLSIRVADLGLLDAMMNRLRVSPPESFGGSARRGRHGPGRGQRTAAAHRGPAVPDQGPQPRHHPAQRHRTEAQVLPGGHPQCRLGRRTAGGPARGPRRAGRRPRGRPRGAGPLAPGSGPRARPQCTRPQSGYRRWRAGVPACRGILRCQVVDLLVQRRGERRAGPRDPVMPRAMTCAPVAGSSWATAKTSPDTVRNSATWRPAISAASPQAGSRSSTAHTRCQPAHGWCVPQAPVCALKYGSHFGPSRHTSLTGSDRCCGHIPKLGPRCFSRHAVECVRRVKETSRGRKCVRDAEVKITKHKGN